MNKINEQKLDNIDKKIISELEQDGRVSYASLGETIGLSKTPCWNRVKELTKAGVIEGYSANLSPTALGLNIRALVHVVVNFDLYQEFEKAINEHRSIRSCHAVTGDFDYVLEILATDINAFDQLLRADLSRLPGVARFKTSISTRMVKSSGHYSLMF